MISKLKLVLIALSFICMLTATACKKAGSDITSAKPTLKTAEQLIKEGKMVEAQKYFKRYLETVSSKESELKADEVQKIIKIWTKILTYKVDTWDSAKKTSIEEIDKTNKLILEIVSRTAIDNPENFSEIEESILPLQKVVENAVRKKEGK